MFGVWDCMGFQTVQLDMLYWMFWSTDGSDGPRRMPSLLNMVSEPFQYLAKTSVHWCVSFFLFQASVKSLHGFLTAQSSFFPRSREQLDIGRAQGSGPS